MRHAITDEQIERFWSNVEPFKAVDACWQWVGRTHHGMGEYGEFEWGLRGSRRTARAHRHAYELLVGEIPEGLTIDHLCRNTLCVNPDHMEPVTALENRQRGYGGRPWSRGGETSRSNGRTYKPSEPRPRWRPVNEHGVATCPRGHAIEGENAMSVKGRVSPTCRQCRVELNNQSRARRRAA